MTTELVALSGEKCDDPRLAVCYGRSTLRKEGHFYRVEKGARTVVHRSLCVLQVYGSRCAICPNSQIKVILEVKHGPDPAQP